MSSHGGMNEAALLGGERLVGVRLASTAWMDVTEATLWYY